MPAPQAQDEPAVKVFRDFDGMAARGPRQSIADEKAYWLENLQPIAPGDLKVVPPQSATLVTVSSQTVVASQTFNISGTDYVFAIMASGHAYAILANSPYTATQITATLGAVFSASTRMAQWKNAGVLFIDPTGYYDYNVTTAGALSAISRAVIGLAVGAAGTGYTSRPTLSFSGGGGSGAAGTVDLTLVGAVTSIPGSGGAGYTVGDVLTLTGGSFSQVAQVQVASIGGGGAVLTVNIVSVPLSDYTVLPAMPAPTTGGTGTGCTINWAFGITNAQITNAGTGYAAPPVVTVTGGGGSGGTVTATVSAAFAGTSIETFSGRVWIGNGRTIAFTDVNSYNSFTGAGSSFTITDQTLHANITRLIAANGYLYIFGDDSIDILGDVQVAAGVTSFTRQNITASVGTVSAWSVFPYLRSLAFANYSGFWLLSGSTPQKISNDIDDIISAIDTTKEIFGGQVMVNNQLCAAFLFYLVDTFTPIGGTRPVLAVFYQGRWWIAQQGTTLKTINSLPKTGISTLMGLATSGSDTVMTQLFSAGALLATWQLITKLWDGGNPMVEKQVIRAGMGIKWSGSNAGASITMKVDNESGLSVAVTNVPATPFPTSGYTFNAGAANANGGNFFGMTITGTTLPYQITQLAAEHREGARWKTP